MGLNRISGLFPRILRALGCLAVLLGAQQVQAARSAAEAGEAQALIKKEKFTEAAAMLAPLVDKEDPDALVLQGLLLATGAGVALDASAASEMWQRAAHAGQRDAIRLLIPGLYDDFQRIWWTERLAEAVQPVVKLPANMVQLERGRVVANSDAALRWNEQQATRKEPMAWFNLYALRRLQYEWMTRPDELLASLKKAALAGYTPALLELASIYEDDPAGIRMPMRLQAPDVRQSAIYLQRAAETGDPRAQLLWAHRLSSGRGGVDKNPGLALEYYRKSSEQGNVYAPYFLYEAYSEGEVVAKDDSVALEYLKLAANRDNDLAATILGEKLFHGENLPKDEAAAVSLLVRTLVIDTTPNDDAVALVAYAYLFGRGVPQDETVAFRWAEWGARRGSVAAKFQLGMQYLQGRGVTKDEIAGYTQLLAAKSGGYREARLVVAQCLLAGIGTAKDMAQGIKELETIKAENQADATNATYVLAQIKLGGAGSGYYDLAAAMELLGEAAGKGHSLAKLIHAVLEAEQANDDAIALELVGRALDTAAKEGLPLVQPMLAKANGNAREAARTLLQVPVETVDEAEITRRIAALSVTSQDTRPRAVYQPNPHYPHVLSVLGTEGHAMVEFVIDETGRVAEAEIISSSHVAFGEPARRAVLKWRFAPAIKNGRPIRIKAKQELDFTLDKEEPAKKIEQSP